MRIIVRFFLLSALVVAAPAAKAETVRVEISKLVFAPAEIKAEVGDVIEWVNDDFIAHTATARDGRFNVMLEPGKAGRYTVQQAGLIEYYCRFHPNMTGRLSVSR